MKEILFGSVTILSSNHMHGYIEGHNAVRHLLGMPPLIHINYMINMTKEVLDGKIDCTILTTSSLNVL